MNEQVEMIYEQMFAPQPIPQSVKTLFDRTNFFLNRIDGQMRTGNLALIAALATVGKVPTVEQPEAGGTEIVDTSEIGEISPVQPNVSLYVNNPTEKTIKPMNSSVPQTSVGPTGLMDAPNTPDVGRQAKRIELLQGMSKQELYAHAEEFYGLKANAFVGKKKGRPSRAEMNKVRKDQIIEKLLSMTPIK